MLFGEYLMIVEESNLLNTINRLFKGSKGQLRGCLKVFNMLKGYYLEYKDSEKDPIEQDISMYVEEDGGKAVLFSHIKPHHSEYNYSMYGQPWKLLPFHEVKFENCWIPKDDVVATVIWELTWWGFWEPVYDGLTFNFISDPNKTSVILNKSSYINGRRLI